MGRGQTVLLFAALLSTGCLNFPARLESCRDADGVWICPDAGRPADVDGGDIDGGSTDAGGPDAGTTDGGVDPYAGLVCQNGWCWEHPRPGGIALTSIWGRSRDDLWVGGESGFLAHWDGATWTNHSRGYDLTITSMCGHDEDVFFGMGTFGSGASPERIMRYASDGGWAPLSFNKQVSQVVCGSKLWVSNWSGASSLDWSTLSETVLVSPVANELCMSIVETPSGETLIGCRADGTVDPYARIYRGDGTVELDRPDDGGSGTSYYLSRLWEDPTRGTLVGVMGAMGQVWQRDAGWAPAWSGSGSDDIYAGMAYDGGSVAVGGYGTVVDFTANTVTPRNNNSPPAGNGYLAAVWTPPSGDAISVGQWGCISERTSGTWSRRNQCHVGFIAVSVSPRQTALTDDGIYVREPAGWTQLESLPEERLAYAPLADGGFVTLSSTSLHVGATEVPLGITNATDLVVAKGSAAITTSDGGLSTVSLSSFTPAVIPDPRVVGQPVVDADGTVWVPRAGGQVLVGTSATTWVPESTTLTTELTDLAVGFGKVWALSGRKLAYRAVTGGPWAVLTAQHDVTRVVPVSETQVLIINATAQASLLDLQGVRTPAKPPPVPLTGRVVVKNGELWSLASTGGSAGLLRMRLP